MLAARDPASESGALLNIVNGMRGVESRVEKIISSQERVKERAEIRSEGMGDPASFTKKESGGFTKSTQTL